MSVVICQRGLLLANRQPKPYCTCLARASQYLEPRRTCRLHLTKDMTAGAISGTRIESLYPRFEADLSQVRKCVISKAIGCMSEKCTDCFALRQLMLAVAASAICLLNQ